MPRPIMTHGWGVVSGEQIQSLWPSVHRFATGLAPIGASRFDQKAIITVGTFGCGYTADPIKIFDCRIPLLG